MRAPFGRHGLRSFTLGKNRRNKGECIKTARAEFILQQQLELVLAAVTPDNRRVLQVMLRTGLRISDVLQLRTEQLGRQFMVKEQKTGKSVRCGLPDWLTKEIKSAAHGSVWAFPSPLDREQHRTRQAVWKDLKRVQRAFRMPVNMGTHSMRKVYAVDLMEKYGDIERVRKALNHSSATVTVLYAMADILAATAPKRRVTHKRKRSPAVNNSRHCAKSAQ